MEVFILIFMVVAIGLGLKGLEYALAASKQPKAIEPKNYNDRWTDPDYVQMVHETIELEKAELGEAVTKCEANCCKPVKGSLETKKMNYIPYTPPYIKERQQKEDYYYRVVDGYKFKVADLVPAGAMASLMPINYQGYNMFRYAAFTWFDINGEKNVYMVMCHAERDWVGQECTCEGEIEVDQLLDAARVYKEYKAECEIHKAERDEYKRQTANQKILNKYYANIERSGMRVDHGIEIKSPILKVCDNCGIRSTGVRDGLCSRCRRISGRSDSFSTLNEIRQRQNPGYG